MIHVSQDIIGRTKDPITKELCHIYRFTLANDQNKMVAQVLSYGATIYSLQVPNAKGYVGEVVLGFDLLEEYVHPRNPYFGAIIGRVCNRIGDANFRIYEKHIRLTKNHGNHHLHGGFIGFNKMPWGLREIHPDGVTFDHYSRHCHEGYPGEVYATVRYTLTEDNELRIHMTAKTNMTTVINMTNHSYFNLAGHAAGKKGLYEHNITIFADHMTETNEQSIPTGIIKPVVGSSYDFRTIQNIGKRIQELQPDKLGFDDNFCLPHFNLKKRDVLPAARVIHPPSGRMLDVYSNQPGVQFYTANYLPDEEKGEEPIFGKSGVRYYKHGAFCLETQGFPDSPNHPNFPEIILRPGVPYEHIVIYKFGTWKEETPLASPEKSEDISCEDLDASLADVESLADEETASCKSEDQKGHQSLE